MGRLSLAQSPDAWVRAPWFTDWWNEEGTWKEDPMGPIYERIEQDRVKR